MVLKTKSCNLFTVRSKSSPSDAMVTDSLQSQLDGPDSQSRYGRPQPPLIQ